MAMCQSQWLRDGGGDGIAIAGVDGGRGEGRGGKAIAASAVWRAQGIFRESWLGASTHELGRLQGRGSGREVSFGLVSANPETLDARQGGVRRV